MRFRTRCDRWLVALLGIAGVASCGLIPVLRFLAPGVRPGPVWMSFIAWPIWALCLAATLPQYYEVRDDGLFIRQGWKRFLLPYDALIELQSFSNALSGPVFSTQRLMVVTRDGRKVLIAVRDEGRFLDEVARRAPQLERKSFGLGMAFTPSSVI